MIDRIHMGCGAVYLSGYLNVDLPTPRTHLAVDRPDLVERYVTTEEHYYARHADKTVDSLRRGPLDQEYVCDRYGSFFFIPVAHPVVEILARHSFEHLSLSEARLALDTLRRALIPGGVLRIDVPDHSKTLKLYSETRDPFYERHMFGPQRGDYGFHVMSYTIMRLRHLVEEHGFEFFEIEPNIHVYPAFCLRFIRK